MHRNYGKYKLNSRVFSIYSYSHANISLKSLAKFSSVLWSHLLGQAESVIVCMIIIRPLVSRPTRDVLISCASYKAQALLVSHLK